MLVAEHAPHAPDGWHAGVAPPQSASATQPRQTWVAPSHTGSLPVHVAPVRQPTQAPRATSHIDVPPMQAVMLVAEHAPHAPEGWQAGVAPPQSASLAQARHMFVPVSQTGLVAPHWPGAVHEAHVPVVASQPATGPEHWVVFVAEQTPHAPDGWQAGVDGDPAQSASLAQAWQTCVVALQTGVAPPHCALVTHPTHAPPATSQTDVAPAQRRVFVAEHWPHAPDG
jgi:hypothetical protein